jgi:hypothetical protein
VLFVLDRERERERDSVCMYVCVYEREKEREIERGLLRLKVDDRHLFAPHLVQETV